MDSSETAAERTHGEPLEALVKVAGLLALALPLVGVGVRFIAFQAGGVPIALDMATRESVVALAATAFNATWPSVLVALAFTLAISQRWLPGFDSEADRGIAIAHPRYWKWRLRVDRAVVGVFSIGAVLLLSWPGGVLTGLSGVGMGMTVALLDLRKQLTIYSAALLVIAMGTVNAIGAGLEGKGVGDEVNSYHFASKAGLPPDGRYILIGEGDGILYLQSCAAGNPMVAVNVQDVARFSIGTQSSPVYIPALINILFRHQTPELGYRPHC